MKNPTEIMDLITCREYQEILNEIKSHLPTKVHPGDNEAQSALLETDLNNLQTEILGIRSLLLETKSSVVYPFTKPKTADDREENAAASIENESPTPRGSANDYVLDNMIEMIVLKQGREKLESYLKDAHIPDQQKYASQILNWLFSEKPNNR